MNGKNLFAAFEELCESFDVPINQRKNKPIPTGIDFLQQFIGDFQAGDLVLLESCQREEATALALQMATGICLEKSASLPVVYFTFGNPASKIALRIFVQTTKRSSFEVSIDLSDPNSWDDLQKQIPDRLASNIFIVDEPVLSIQDVKWLCRGFRIGIPPGAIFIDHSGLVRPCSGPMEIGYMSKEFKKLARELGTVVVALINLPHPSVTQENDFSYSLNRISEPVIEHDADHILHLHRMQTSSCLEEDAEAEIKVEKTAGKAGSIRVLFDRETTLFKKPLS